jgi:hypothetical protein
MNIQRGTLSDFSPAPSGLEAGYKQTPAEKIRKSCEFSLILPANGTCQSGVKR